MLSKSQLQVKLRILMRMWRNLNSNKLIHTESESRRVKMLEISSRRYFSISLCSLIYLKPLSSSLFVWTCLPVKKIFNASFLWNSLDLTLAIIDSHQRAVCQFKEADSCGRLCIMTDTALDKVNEAYVVVLSCLFPWSEEITMDGIKWQWNHQISREFYVFFPAPHICDGYWFTLVLSLGNRLSLRALWGSCPVIRERLSEICGSVYWDTRD